MDNVVKASQKILWHHRHHQSFTKILWNSVKLTVKEARLPQKFSSEVFNVIQRQWSSNLLRNLPPNISTTLWCYRSAVSAEFLQLSSVENGVALDGFRRSKRSNTAMTGQNGHNWTFGREVPALFWGNGFSSSCFGNNLEKNKPISKLMLIC